MAEFIRLSDTKYFNACQLVCAVISLPDDPPSACLHMAHGKEELAGDEAVAFADWLTHATGDQQKAADTKKKAAKADEKHAPAHHSHR